MYRLYPEQFGDFFSWEWYDKLPKTANVDVFPFSNFVRIERPYSAWHIGSVGIFPHTKRYRCLRAILENDLDELKLVLDQGFDLNKPIDSRYGYTPLSLASNLNRTAVIQYLYMRGADLDLPDKSGNTPLMQAVKNWQFGAIQVLDKLGCEILKKDKFGFDAIQKSKQRGLNAIAKFLIDCQEKKPKREKNFPKMNVKFDIENQFLDQTNSLIKDKKDYSGQPLYYPFNDLSGNYSLRLLNWKKIMD